MAHLGTILQLLGTALALFGLGQTWWKWSDDSIPLKAWIRRLRGPIALRGSANASIISSGTVTADGQVRRSPSGSTIDARVDAVLLEIDDLHREIRERAQKHLEDIANLKAVIDAHRAEVTESLAMHHSYIEERTTDVAVDGIGWAAIGIGLTLLGMIVSALFG